MPQQAEERTGRDPGPDLGSHVGPDAPTPDPDQDLPAAVGRELAHYLARRQAQAARGAERFAVDLVRPLTDFVLRGGKRLRPLAVWWGWRAAGGPAHGDRAAAVLRAAGAVELLQACALIHDDLMDRSPLRRNAPALHVAFAHRHRAAGLHGDPERFGLSTAVLAGDLALLWAEDLWQEAGLAPDARERARQPWREMRSEMVAGQYLDLYRQAEGNESAVAALRVASLKSARYTMERPLQLGAALAGAGPPVTAALRRAGRCLGLAFQLRDDLLSVYGTPAQTGKPAGEDVREGKRTYLMAVALRLAREQGRPTAESVLREALGDPRLSPAALERVRTVLTDLGAPARVEEHIRRLTDRALHTLRQAPLPPPAGDRLVELARGLTAPPGTGGAQPPPGHPTGCPRPGPAAEGEAR